MVDETNELMIADIETRNYIINLQDQLATLAVILQPFANFYNMTKWEKTVWKDNPNAPVLLSRANNQKYQIMKKDFERLRDAYNDIGQLRRTTPTHLQNLID